MWKINGRTIIDDFIVKIGPIEEAFEVVKKLEKMGYEYWAGIEKINCYYVGRSVIFDDGSQPTKKLVNWGRNEVEESGEFDKMMTYEEFMALELP